MKSIEGRARTVRELLDGAKYTIDFYQREYAWQERQVRELIDDLTGKFLDFYDEGHSRPDVENYGHYFLGSVVVSHKRSQRFVVDGQQRLTTLTLLLIYLHHLQNERSDHVPVKNLIFSEKFGRRSFNLDVPERTPVMDALFLGERFDTEGHPSSVQNITLRYDNIADHFPEDLHTRALPYFVDWLLENVHFVEIEAYSDEDAYTIFETMNDRGLSLSLPEMLKGYILANIRHEDDQRRVNDIWKQHIQDLKALGVEEDVDFFKNWFRGQYAESIRPGKKGAENKDYERIGTEFHRWVRDQKERLSLNTSDDYVRFVTRDLDFFVRQTLLIRRAATTLTPGLESIRYNEERGFTLQTQLLLAPLATSDKPETIRRKIKLVADFIDIWIARRVWTFRTIAYSSIRYTLFNLARDLRGKSVEDLSSFLRSQLDAQPERFARSPLLRLHNQNYRQVRHILARLTHWVDTECGIPSHFEDLVSEGQSRPFEIEHIWPNHYDRYANLFHHPSEFDEERNRIGGLLLLQRGVNQSLGDAPYEEKLPAYLAKGENLLARSLHPIAYVNDPSFARLRERSGLSFKPYAHFGTEEQRERQVLYVRLAEWVWNPARLSLGEMAPPEHEPLNFAAPDLDDDADREPDGPRHVECFAFWTDLLTHAATRTSLLARVSPGKDTWIGFGGGRTGVSFNLVVLQDSTRAELYINTGSRDRNKSFFDQLFHERLAIEAVFGGPMEWHRLNEKNTARIAVSFEYGGWSDRGTWSKAIPPTVDAILRLHDALKGPVERFETSLSPN